MKKKFLFVEDNKYLTEIIKYVCDMDKTNYNLILADEGESALKRYNENKKALDLIILDLNLPKINGNELMNIIRKENKKIPIILSTGEKLSNNQQQNYIKNGFNRILIKPYKLNDLISIFNQYLN